VLVMEKFERGLDLNQICRRCVMNTTDPGIYFDKNGVCNHCHEYDLAVAARIFPEKIAKQKLGALVKQIKSDGRNKSYDCVIGVSGGIDSTYVAYLVRQLGLRPLAVHLDNGWNSELAVKNIERVLRKLKIDLHTHVINWKEFRDLQLSFLKASTPDSEIPTDHAIVSLMWHSAARIGVKYIISGCNVRTESHLPQAWSQGHLDWGYILKVHQQFGRRPLTTFPHTNFFSCHRYRFTRQWIDVLNYVDYNKKEAKELMAKELGWCDYGEKHFESIYTKFFMGYILPNKFGFDMRRVHYSSLICSGQLLREEALEKLSEELYPYEQLEQDKKYVIKKLGLTLEKFDEIMNLPPKKCSDYSSYGRLLESRQYRILRTVYKWARKQVQPNNTQVMKTGETANGTASPLKQQYSGKTLFVTHDMGLYGGAAQSLQTFLRNYKFRKVDLVVNKRFARRNDFEQLRKKFGNSVENIYEFYLPIDFCYKGRPRHSSLRMFLRKLPWWLLRWKFYRQLDIGQYDYICLNSLVLHPMVRRKYPFVIHIREILDARHKQAYQSVRKASGAIFIDEATRQPFLPQVNGELVLNNPFDMRLLEQYGVDDLKYNFDYQRKTVFCTVGRINENKGISFLIEAFKRLHSKDVVLILVGSSEKNFIAKCRQLAGGDQRIIFLDEEPEIGKIYRVSDYILRGEAYPCIGRTIYEGLYAGCGVIVPGTTINSKMFFEYEKFQDRIHFYKPRDVDALQRVFESLAGKKIQERIYRSNVEEYISKFESYVSEKLEVLVRNNEESTEKKLEEVKSISL